MAVPRSLSDRGLISIQGLDELKQGLTALQQEQYPFAMKNAINATSAKVKDAVVRQMHADIANPVPFTLNAMAIDYASKTNLKGRVHFKDPARLSESQHYLYPIVYGVRRGFKKFEAALFARGILPARWYAVPGKDQPLDQYGNVPSSLIIEILAWFNANAVVGSTSGMTDATRAKRRAGTRKTFGYEFFALRKQSGGMLPGIYRRVFFPDQTKVYSVFIFVPESHVGYQRTYRFHEEGRRVFDAEFRSTFGEELQKAMETALK